MRTDALRFALDALLADGENIIDSGVRCVAPLTVPEEGVQSWELCGSQTLALGDGVELPAEFTVAVWCKLLPLASRQSGSLLSGSDGVDWLEIGDDSLRLGTTGLAAPLPSLATSWHLLVMCGTKGGSSTLAFAGAGDARPQVLCAAPWAPDALVLVGDPCADIGHVSSVQMWSRRLEIAEQRSLWVSGCTKHGLPPPPEWVDWRAAPAAGTARVIGTAADALTGAALGDVRVCAVKRGDGHPLSGAYRAVAESGGDGAFGIEVPMDEAEEKGVLVLTLTLAGYAPQTLSVAMRGGDTAVVPRARLLRLGARATVAAAEGGTMVDEATGATFTIPRAAFLNPDGTAFVGTAAVCAAAIDPSDAGSLAAMPGDFRATTLGGAPVLLRSFGAFYFSAADEAGGVLAIDETCGGVLVEWESSVAMDIAGKCAELPSVWRFDDAACLWLQLPSPLEVEGTPLPSPGTKAFDEALDAPDAPPVEAADTKGRAAGKKGKGKGAATTVEQKAAAAAKSAAAVASFLDLFAKPEGIKLRMALKANDTWINCDAPYHACLLRGRLRGWAARPASWLSVRAVAVGVEYAARSFATIDAQGGFSMLVQQHSEVLVEVEVDPEDVLEQEKQAASAAAATAAAAGIEARVTPADCADRVVRLGPFTSLAVGEIKELGELGLTDDVAPDR